MTDIAVPRPALVTVPGVELLKTGTWHASTGWHTFTAADLTAAVASQDDIAVRSPFVKLGHVDPRFDGQPTIGRVTNLRTTDNGQTLVGDLEGVPAWIAEIMPTAWPSRSVEGQWDYQTANGTTHPFVLTALALLGVDGPAVETLEDVAALYGVAAAQADDAGHGRPFAVHLKERPMPQRVELSTSTEDIRRAYYDGPGSGWAWWICELQVDPQQLIAENEDDGELYRVPYAINGDEITFEDPVKVNVTYVDVAAAARPVAASAGRWRTRAESRPDTPDRPKAAAAGPQGQEGDPPVDLSQIREALGLPDDASDDDVLTAVIDKLTEPAPPAPATDPAPVPAPAAVLPGGVTTIDESTLGELIAAAAAGKAAHETLRQQARDRFLDEAVHAGKFAPARAGHFAALYDADEEGTRQVIAGLAAGTIPLIEAGHSGQADMSDFEAAYLTHYGQPALPKEA